MCLDLDVFELSDPDGYPSASDVKDRAEEVISSLPLPGVGGSPLDPDDIWLVVILACVNKKDDTTTCHRYCTAYVVSNEKPVTLAMAYVRNDEDEADAVERVLARVDNYPFETELLLADSGFYNERVIRRARDIAATVVHVQDVL